MDGGKKILILSAEDNKARFWMATIAKEIERLRHLSVLLPEHDMSSTKGGTYECIL